MGLGLELVFGVGLVLVKPLLLNTSGVTRKQTFPLMSEILI
jgi:hypothetical protein